MSFNNYEQHDINLNNFQQEFGNQNTNNLSDHNNNNNINNNINNNNNKSINKDGQLSTEISKKILTFIYCLTFWNFGICVALFGPTLLDLACQTSSTLSAMSILYFMQNFTSLIGVFVSGILLKKRR
jgi:hypothetical protein